MMMAMVVPGGHWKDEYSMKRRFTAETDLGRLKMSP